MSASYDKGRDFEREVASVIRRKIDKGAKRDNKSGALWTRRSDVMTSLPISIECKHHESIKIREFFRQAKQAASIGQMPAAVFPIDNEIVACVPFDELIDLYVEIEALQDERDMLREPVHTGIDMARGKDRGVTQTIDKSEAVELASRATAQKASQGVRTCKNGHIVSGGKKCLWKGCKYSTSYNAKKDKKK